MKTMLKNLKKGDYFKVVKKNGELSTQVYVKGEYERTLKKYSTHKFEDVCNERFMKGETCVTTEFEF